VDNKAPLKRGFVIKLKNMNIKQFLKPDFKRIIIFIAILISLFLFQSICVRTNPSSILYFFYLIFPLLVPGYILLMLGEGMQIYSALSVLLIGIVISFLWWIVTCALFYLLNKKINTVGKIGIIFGISGIITSLFGIFEMLNGSILEENNPNIPIILSIAGIVLFSLGAFYWLFKKNKNNL